MAFYFGERHEKEKTIYTDCFKSYDGLADFDYKRHYRIKHSDNQFAERHNHINRIQNFWGLCKVRLAKFKGVHHHKFYLHLKESEYRYNNRNTDIYKRLLKIIRDNPIKLS